MGPGIQLFTFVLLERVSWPFGFSSFRVFCLQDTIGVSGFAVLGSVR